MARRRYGALVAIVFAVFIVAGQPRNGWAEPMTSRTFPDEMRRSRHDLRLGDRHVSFDVSSDASLRELVAVVNRELQEKPGNKGEPDATEDSSPGDTSKPGHLGRGAYRGLKKLVQLAQLALDDPNPGARGRAVALLLETVMAVNNSQRSPVPGRVDSFEAPVELLRRLHSPVGHGEKPASNLLGGLPADLSRLDPEPSTFWARPADIPAENLYAGFGRTKKLELGDRLCTYAGPKDSFGLNPGFEVNRGAMRLKLKFAELHSEPFASRIFAALGYHADSADFVPRVKVCYDRRIFQEFNSRRQMTTQFTLLGVLPVYRLKLQQHYDPFAYITAAVLRDGRSWPGRLLRQRLLRDISNPRAETDAANFRPEVEAQIEYLITAPANIQPKERGIKTIGPWDFGQLDHAGRRELRGAGLLAAWLGWFDSRYDNTRLRLVKDASGVKMVHYFSDLGGVLGETSGWLFEHGEQPNAFPWTFTRPPLWQGPHRLARPLRLAGYKPIALTPAFAEMTIDDARWMGRLIARLTETQIVQALVASGFDSAQVRLYTEKLLSRRDRMLVDLGLSGEFKLYRPHGVDRTLTYDPRLNGPVIVDVPGQGQVQAPINGYRVNDGKLSRSESLVRNATLTPHKE